MLRGLRDLRGFDRRDSAVAAKASRLIRVYGEPQYSIVF
jgi:hypothetical protein